MPRRLEPSRLGFLLAAADARERHARLRELRALCFCFFGSGHPISDSFSAAVADPRLAHDALRALEGAPSLQRRRVLASFCALIPAATAAPRGPR